MTYRRLLPLLLASACVAPGESETTSAVINARTVISLTFDDTLADQFQVGDMAAARGMRATFYINGPRVGTSGYLSKAQVIALEQAGHEIAGHTLSHANLPTLSPEEARSQICNDRANLLNQGFRVTSFAYPFGADNTSVQQIVEDCGYNSARDVGGLKSAGLCPGCPWTNPVPPANLYMIRTNDSIQTDTPLSIMQQYVIDAEQNGGGYVPFVFHHVCEACDSNAVTPAQLAAFLDWLQQRAPATQVGTVDQEIGGEVEPPITYPSVAPSNLLANASLETDADSNQVPDCWQRGGYGTNTASYSLVTDAFDGGRAQRIDVTSFSSGGRRLVSAQDAGACAPSVTAGHRYTVTAYYKANVQPRFTVYYRSASGVWSYFAESAVLPTSTTYRQATYTTPAMPSGATAISIGLTIYAVGSITMDAHTLVDADGPSTPPADTVPPSITIACNGTICSPNAYSMPISVSLAGWDFSGIRDIRYTTNGSDPATSGSLYTTPFTVSSTTTVRAIGRDNANNSIALTRTIRFGAIDTTAPALSIACNGTACASTPYAAPVTVSLAASDASGIREIRYTLDGSDPAGGTLYTSAFTVSSSATVRATAVDNAGNRTSISQPIAISAGPTNLLQNASLELDADNNQVPDCWQRGGYGTNTASFTLAADAFDGARAQNVTISSFTSGGRRIVSAQDSGACAPAVTSGSRYTMTVYYKSNVPPRFSVYYRNTAGSWVWFAESPALPTSSAYRQATYTTPAMPADATAISIGLSIFGVGSLTSDAYTLVEAP